MHRVPPDFARLVAEARRGQNPRVVVRDLVRWFGFDRRGARVNEYIREVMQQEGVRCTPPLDAPFPDDELVISTLVPVVASPPPPSRDLPHPIACFGAIIVAQADLATRVATRLDGIEVAIAYLLFAELAAIRAAGVGTYPGAVRHLLSASLPRVDAPGPPLSFGTIVEYARKLEPFVPAKPKSISESAQAFADGVGVVIANEIVPLRNKLKHGSNVPESWYRDTEPRLQTVDHQLRGALRPLLECELFCVHETQPGEREAYCYGVRTLHGDRSYFRPRKLETSSKLSNGWAYLEYEPGAPPLRLAPGIACEEDRVTEQVQLYVSRTLALDAGARVASQAVVGVEQRKWTLPA